MVVLIAVVAVNLAVWVALVCAGIWHGGSQVRAGEPDSSLHAPSRQQTAVR